MFSEKPNVTIFCCSGTKEVSLSNVKDKDWKKKIYIPKQIPHGCAGSYSATAEESLTS